MDSSIQDISAREILDSRGNPTLCASLKAEGAWYHGFVPSGASTGKHEAVELRDNDQRYGGKGVRKAVSHVNDIIAKKIIGMDPADQQSIDEALIALDGTADKSRLGANALLGVSLAAARAGAAILEKPLYTHIANLAGTKKMILPHPFMNIINGGKHAGQAHDAQEHLIVPVKGKTFHELLQTGAEVYHTLKAMLKKRYGPSSILLGDEGGFVAPLKTVEERFDLILEAIDASGHDGEVKLALDAAASEFYRKGTYSLGEHIFDADSLADHYLGLADAYPLVSIEDGFDEEDWAAWKAFMPKARGKFQVIGDDLLCTNQRRIARAIDEHSCDVLLLKVNQIGTLTEAIKASQLAMSKNWKVQVSHRSGETEDPFIADLVVGLGTGQSKFGAVARSERTAKYNRLLGIEDELGKKAFLSSW
ncbi:MAG: phosphopyruvate hydratase [DPANN group archaeon]|nr:phosphopyruvate hydratase [DPANN group archaeon]